MKTLYLLTITLVFLLTGCNNGTPVQTLTVCIFEPTEPDKIASEADLELLEAYAKAIHNPQGDTRQVSEDELDRIGYKFRLSSNQHSDSPNKQIFNQGLPSHPKAIQDVAIGELASNPNGDYELSIYVGEGKPADLATEFSRSHVSINNSGTMTLSKGWIASWSVESIKQN